MATALHSTPSGVNEPGLLPVSPHPRFVELIQRKKLRIRIEAVVSRLIAALDALDSDPDLEDTHDAESVNEDGDVLDGGERDDSDYEPSLGAPESCIANQTGWAKGSDRDLEL